jgi:hypothetical protein
MQRSHLQHLCDEIRPLRTLLQPRAPEEPRLAIQILEAEAPHSTLMSKRILIIHIPHTSRAITLKAIVLELVAAGRLIVDHIAVAKSNLLALGHISHDVDCFSLDRRVPTKARIGIACVVEAGSVREDGCALVYLHAVCLEDADERWVLGCAGVVLFLDALALSGGHALAYPGWPFARVLAVPGVQAVVERLLGGRQALEDELDVAEEVVARGDD